MLFISFKHRPSLSCTFVRRRGSGCFSTFTQDFRTFCHANKAYPFYVRALRLDSRGGLPSCCSATTHGTKHFHFHTFHAQLQSRLVTKELLWLSDSTFNDRFTLLSFPLFGELPCRKRSTRGLFRAVWCWSHVQFCLLRLTHLCAVQLQFFVLKNRSHNKRPALWWHSWWLNFGRLRVAEFAHRLCVKHQTLVATKGWIPVRCVKSKLYHFKSFSVTLSLKHATWSSTQDNCVCDVKAPFAPLGIVRTYGGSRWQDMIVIMSVFKTRRQACIFNSLPMSKANCEVQVPRYKEAAAGLNEYLRHRVWSPLVALRAWHKTLWV